MKKYSILIFCFSYLFFGCHHDDIKVGTLELVTNLDVRPGNVTVSRTGRVFSTIHPLDKPKIQLIEITGENSYELFPSVNWQKNGQEATEDKFDAPHGIIIDKDDNLWTIDAGFELGKIRLMSFDINSRELLRCIEIPEDFIVKGSFVQDLAIDVHSGFAYLADTRGAIIFVDLKNEKFRRFEDVKLKPEDIDMVIDEEIVLGKEGKPVRVGLNPITLSDDNETLFFGSMIGTKWYSVSTKLFIENKSDEEISSGIKIFGKKPISDGCSTDAEGNHFFTNLSNNSIDILSKDGVYKTLVKDKILNWPDNVRFGQDSWLYISVNQLHKSKGFTGKEDRGVLPYKIVRVWTGTKGRVGK